MLTCQISVDILRRMYGKHFESLYEGSMYGAGVAVFAVWGYVIAKTKFSRIELNPKKLADTLGGTEEQIREAIEYLCLPDPGSRNQSREGRRLIKEGMYQYFVTGWEEYQKIRNEVERREYNKNAKRAERARKKKEDAPSGPLNGETEAIKALEDGRISESEFADLAATTREHRHERAQRFRSRAMQRARMSAQKSDFRNS